MSDGSPIGTDLEGLYQAVQRLTSAETEQAICEAAVAAVPAVFDGALGGLWLYDADAAELTMAAATDREDDRFEGSVTYRAGSSVSWEAFDTGEVRTHSYPPGDGSGDDPESTVASELVLPLGDHGVMNVGTTEPDAFGPDERMAAKILAANVETALTNAERQHALRVKNDHLEEVVGAVSHDLRNPLNVACGFLEHARRDGDGGEAESLERVAGALDRMDTLIDDLLTLAEEGYVVDDRTRLDLATVAQRAWSNVHTPDATLETEGSIEIFADETRLLQVFENLFRNSVEHGSTSPDSGEDETDDGVTVRVGAVQQLHTSTRIPATETGDGFYVADDGPGIPAEQRPEVFDRGQSAGGTGLGLAIVERIVEAHGWTVAVDEAVGGGARFDITGDAKPVAPFRSV